MRIHGVTSSRSGNVEDADAAARRRHFQVLRRDESAVQAWWRLGGYKHE